MKEMFEGQGSPPDVSMWGENMLAPDEVAAMVRLKSLGWGTRKIAAVLGCSRTTVKRYIEAGGFAAYRQPRRGRRLDGLDESSACLCPLLGLPAASLCALSGTHQGQGRARRRLCQAQCHRRSCLCQLGGTRGASRLVDARDCRSA